MDDEHSTYKKMYHNVNFMNKLISNKIRMYTDLMIMPGVLKVIKSDVIHLTLSVPHSSACFTLSFAYAIAETSLQLSP